MQNKLFKNLIFTLIISTCFVNSCFCANYLQCEQAIQEGKPFILYLHSNSCYACKQFTPIFNQIVNSIADYNVVDINYSYPQRQNVCSAAESQTIPAVYVVNPQKRIRSKLNYSIYFKQNEFKEALLNLLKE